MKKRKAPDLLKRCHEGRLEGGLSFSLRATPDEVVGPLTHALGAEAKALRVLDVRTGPPMELEILSGALHEKWEIVDQPALIHNLNDLFKDAPKVKLAAVLGEWEDMLQVWCIDKTSLPDLLKRRMLDDAVNVQTLWRAAEPRER